MIVYIKNLLQVKVRKSYVQPVLNWDGSQEYIIWAN